MLFSFPDLQRHTTPIIFSIVIAAFSRQLFSLYFDIRAIFVYAFCIAIVVFSRVRLGTLRSLEHILVFSVTPIALSICVSAYYNDTVYIMDMLWMSASAFIVFSGSTAVHRKAVSVISGILFALLVGAIAGYAWVAAGFDPIFWFANQRGGFNFQPFSFSSAWVTYQIRMNGIFDEPGAFSFYICMTVACRYFLRMPVRLSWFLLLAGMVTVSLAHILFTVLFLFSTVSLPKSRRGAANLCFGILVALASSGFIYASTDIFQALGSRLQPPQAENQLVAGDNRGPRLIAGLEVITSNPKTIVVGAGPDCAMSALNCVGTDFSVGETVLTPMVRWGLLSTYPFYVIMAASVLTGFARRRYMVALAAAGMMFQRPQIHLAADPIFMCLYFAALTSAVKLRWPTPMVDTCCSRGEKLL